ncbi:sodium channel protein 1 brain-like [Anneissia japonica]|uniref:sodium channel protein 1 brain-like n=1 Tax=Anneissia japonica TaxID=1529436 RepID=UPI00142598F4|nr:sodium channel protein 1 brain-like [Anneissia japonica]
MAWRVEIIRRYIFRTLIRLLFRFVLFRYITFFVSLFQVEVGDFTALRAFRVLRALKTISVVPGLKSIINALLRSMKMLGEVMLLTFFVLSIFALLSLQVYMGTLKQKCVASLDITEINETEEFWGSFVNNQTNWYMWDNNPVVCSNISGPGGGWSDCPANYTCLPDIDPNPNYGYTSFDNFGWAMLTCFQLITLDYWENVYNLVIRASGPWNMLYFLMTTMLGAFYLINLMLAVVSMAYTEEVESGGGKDMKKEKESVMTMNAEKLRKMAERKQKIKLRKKQKLQQQKLEEEARKEQEDQGKEKTTLPDQTNTDTNREILKDETTSKASDDLIEENDDDNDSRFADSRDMNSTTGVSKGGNKQDDTSRKIDESDSVHICDYKWCCMCCRQHVRVSKKVYHYWQKFKMAVSWVVLDPLFDLFITLCILLNTIFLALDHYNISLTLMQVLTIGNTIFTIIFTVECAAKVISLDVKYFRTSWNLFDLVIVIVSLIELLLSGSDGSGLSVLRTFRLLRVLKLAQSWTTMRVLLSIIGNTVAAVGNLSLVLLIIIYIFAVIGMQLFGGDYIAESFDEGVVPRWNFVDFQHSLMVIFRILCGEWIEPLYDCMRCSNAGTCILVFILTVIIGNIMVRNYESNVKTDVIKVIEYTSCRTVIEDLSNSSPDESRMNLAFAKLKTFFKSVCVSKCCMKQNKVGDTKETFITNETGKETGKVLIIVDEGSTQDVNNAKEPKLLEMKTISPEEDNKSNVLALKASVVSKSRSANSIQSNGHLPSNQINGNENAVSVQDISHAVGTHRAETVSLERNVDNKRITTLITTNEETGESEVGKEERNGTEQGVVVIDVHEDDELQDLTGGKKVVDCFPVQVNAYFMKKFPSCRGFSKTFCGKTWRRTREVACVVIEHKIFETFILVTIFASSVTLTFEDIYLEGKKTLENVLDILNYVFIVIFTLEMFMKWVGLGFKKYFSSFWCWLDFIIVIISVLSLLADVVGLGNLTAFRSLRTLRALRPLRAISRWQGMKIVVNALAHAIPSIVNVLLVCIVFWLIFSIVGVQFFGGRFYKCIDNDGEILPIDIVDNKTECLYKNYTWTNSNINFDTVINGFVALFQVATFEGWMEVMQASVDARGIDKQPSRESNFIAYIFFVIFIVLGSFLTLNLFIGVIIDNFNKLKKKYEGDNTLDMFLTNNQKNYYSTMRRIGIRKPKKQLKKPTNRIQIYMYELTTSTRFEIAIVCIIFLNMIAMMIEHYQQAQKITDVLQILNVIFTIIFTIEATMKLIGLRWHYFKVPWNAFDFIVVTLSIIGILLSDVLSGTIINPTLLRVLRLFRIGRVLRLIKAAKGIRKLLFALVISMPALFNIGALLFLIIFIYSIIGMVQFSRVKHDGALDDVVNFETWPNSLLLLFRVATSAGWNDVLEPLLTSPPDCDPDYGGYPNGNCGSKTFAILYFMSFLIITYLVVINMYIAIILENFSQAHAQEEVGITEDDFVMFYQIWEKFDPLATQFIAYENLSDFCNELGPPLRLTKPNNIKIAGLDLPIYDDTKLHCLDVLYALTKRVLGSIEETEEFNQLQKQMQERFNESFPGRENYKPTTTTMQIKKRSTAAKVLQRSWRLYKLKKVIGQASQSFRSQSRENSRRPSMDQFESSFSSYGNTLTVPGQANALNNCVTPPTIEEEKKQLIETDSKSEGKCYKIDEQLHYEPKIETVDAVGDNKQENV